MLLITISIFKLSLMLYSMVMNIHLSCNWLSRLRLPRALSTQHRAQGWGTSPPQGKYTMGTLETPVSLTGRLWPVGVNPHNMGRTSCSPQTQYRWCEVASLIAEPVCHPCSLIAHVIEAPLVRLLGSATGLHALPVKCQL